jgi:hypothetical protein
MSDENKKDTVEDLSNVVSLDKAKIDRLKQRGHLGTMLEEFEILRLKLLYDQDMDKQEATRLVTLTKYFIEYGPTEAFRLSCKLMYEKYMKPFGL